MNLSQIRNEFLLKLNNILKEAKEAQIELSFTQSIQSSLNKTTFDIVFVGEFTAGKSSLINAILQQEILPTNLEPTTARITHIAYAENACIKLEFKDGSNRELAFDPTFLKGLIADNKAEISNINSIYIYLNNPILKNGIKIIDTPGTNDTDEQRVSITYRLIPEADAVVYVTIYPVTSTNLEVFNEYIIGNQIQNVFIVLNKIDLLGRNLELAMTDLENHFSKILGEEPFNLYAVSAADYTEGLVDNNIELIENSNCKPFIEDLERFIVGSDKIINLQKQYSAIIDKMKTEAIDLIAFKINALNIPTSEFEDRISILRNDFDEIEKQGIILKQQVESEIDKLVIKIEESLSSLFSEIIESTNELIKDERTEIKSFLKEIEFRIKLIYDKWRAKNEYVIENYLRSINEEISIRLVKVKEEVIESVIKFSDTRITKSVQVESTSQVDTILVDHYKSSIASTALTVGGMLVLSTVGIFPPFAFILGPLAMSWRQKWLQTKKEQLKPQIINSLQEGFQKFRESVIQNIESSKDRCFNEIGDGVTKFRLGMEKQIELVEKDRNDQKSQLEEKIRLYNKTIENIKSI